MEGVAAYGRNSECHVTSGRVELHINLLMPAFEGTMLSQCCFLKHSSRPIAKNQALIGLADHMTLICFLLQETFSINANLQSPHFDWRHNSPMDVTLSNKKHHSPGVFNQWNFNDLSCDAQMFDFVLFVYCGLTSHSAIFQLYSDGTDVKFPNFDLLPGTHAMDS